MMGRQHFLGGVAFWLSSAATVEATMHTHLTTGQMVVGSMFAGGAAMLPDFDQHGSTIGRTYGGITNVVARLIAAVSGGHRNGTHSALGLLAFSAAAWLAASGGGFWQSLLLWMLLGVAARALGVGERHWILLAVGMAGVVFVVLLTGVSLYAPLVGGTTVGVASHIALDMLTPEGCPLLWPLNRNRYGLNVVTTGSKWTSWLVTAALVAWIVLLVLPAGAYVGVLRAIGA